VAMQVMTDAVTKEMTVVAVTEMTTGIVVVAAEVPGTGAIVKTVTGDKNPII